MSHLGCISCGRTLPPQTNAQTHTGVRHFVALFQIDFDQSAHAACEPVVEQKQTCSSSSPLSPLILHGNSAISNCPTVTKVDYLELWMLRGDRRLFI